MLWLAFLLLLTALGLFWWARRQRQAAGLPGGQVIYTDMRGWHPLEKPLYDAELGLTGKPDYLVEKGHQIIPVEVKSSHRGNVPFDAHIYQLAAYCLLVQHTLKKRPPYGILHYANRERSARTRSGQTYRIDYSAQLEKATLDLLAEMHAQDSRKEIARSHESPSRCARCGYRSHCDQRLR